jgi:hypothetical protein
MANVGFNSTRDKLGTLVEQARDTTADLIAVLLQDTTLQTDGALVDHADLAAILAAGNTEATFTNYCVDPETECLTRRLGWTRVGQLRLDDEILAYDQGAHITRWERPSELFVNPHYSGEMWHLSMRGFSAVTTPDHRWPTVHRPWRPEAGRVETKHVLTTEHLPRAEWALLRSAPFEGVPEQDKRYSDAFVRIAAWYFTEGSLIRGGKAVTISQSESHNPVHVDDIRRDLKAIGAQAPVPRTTLCETEGCAEAVRAKKLCLHHYDAKRRAAKRGGQPLLTIPGRDRRDGLFVTERKRSRDSLVTWDLSGTEVDRITVCVPGKTRVPTMEFLQALTPQQARMFVEVCIAGDGTPEHRIFFQHHHARMDAFTVAAVLAGAGPTVGEQGTNCSLNEASPRIRLTNVKRERFDYEGTVWCPVLPSGFWVARREGKVHITGNTRKTLDTPSRTLDNTGDRVLLSVASPITWTAAGGTTNNALRKILYCYLPSSTALDSSILPLMATDIVATTQGTDLQITVSVDGFAVVRNG